MIKYILDESRSLYYYVSKKSKYKKTCIRIVIITIEIRPTLSYILFDDFILL